VQTFGHSARTLQTDRQDKQWTDTIGRTVLQTVAQKQGSAEIVLAAKRRDIGPYIVLQSSWMSATYREFVCAVSAILLFHVWPETADGGVFSPVMRVLHCLVGGRLTQTNFGSKYVVDGLSEGDKISQFYRQGLAMHH